MVACVRLIGKEFDHLTLNEHPVRQHVRTSRRLRGPASPFPFASGLSTMFCRYRGVLNIIVAVLK